MFLQMRVAGLFLMLCTGMLCSAESFVLNNKKKKKPSVSALKNRYLDEVSETVRMVPKLHMQLAKLQEEQIKELAAILADEVSLSKDELQKRIEKMHALNVHLAEEFSVILNDQTVYS